MKGFLRGIYDTIPQDYGDIKTDFFGSKYYIDIYRT